MRVRVMSGAFVAVFAGGLVCGGAGYREINGPGAEPMKTYSRQDRNELNSVVRAINREAARKAREGRNG